MAVGIAICGIGHITDLVAWGDPVTADRNSPSGKVRPSSTWMR